MSKQVRDWIIGIGILVLFACFLVGYPRLMHPNHPEDARYQLGQRVETVIPGEKVVGRIDEVIFRGNMTVARYGVAYVKGGKAKRMKNVKEQDLIPLRIHSPFKTHEELHEADGETLKTPYVDRYDKRHLPPAASPW